MTNTPESRKNHLLAALPAAEWERWLPQLERVEMPLGQVLYESGTTLSHMYLKIILSREKLLLVAKTGLFEVEELLETIKLRCIIIFP